MEQKFIYRNYLENISKKYSSLLGDVTAVYNFDLGDEFELVICDVLTKVLPKKFGVCRGFLVAKDGSKKGDDIIIYDKERFPQIRLFDDKDFARKQEIPIEAAYAYIEAKNSLINGENDKGEPYSFKKALSQVSEVKSLVSTREEISINNAFDPYISIDLNLRKGRKNWPSYINPFFTAIMAPQVKMKPSKTITNPDEITAELKGEYPDKYSPDLVVAGMDVCYLPMIENTYTSPFYIENLSSLVHFEQKGNSFAMGMCSLLYALDTIHLGIMPWPKIILDAIKK